ncbi:uncharacterized protein LAESUDRAFT_764249 [Laetiporus sulphureus 93-53]|uniref:Uncharacterized protein n=1 Tax=Laetiporus sulphureus 93-53 TaxID=1314785 RepID=A0A165BE74_9APHY|nr:uncharacterized protein LAESUDRAFT_764249 [Laetiporus sulphureus 93-53]KZT00857.1 hypothetical protein LAESUDRAFT_764249 [Laetiporus sulphureus 93-53]
MAEINLLRLAIQGLQKVAAPEKFSGHGTPKIKEWLEQIYLYLDDVMDEQLRIKLSLSYLEGDAHDYIDNYYTLVQTTQLLGTWADFVNWLTTSYNTKDKPREAQLEVKRLTKSPWTDMSKFAEKFKKWANKSALPDVDLIEKIRCITPEKILQVHVGTDENQWPITWEAYLNWDLDIER